VPEGKRETQGLKKGKESQKEKLLNPHVVLWVHLTGTCFLYCLKQFIYYYYTILYYTIIYNYVGFFSVIYFFFQWI